MDLMELEYQVAKMTYWENLLKEEMIKMNPDQSKLTAIEKRLGEIYYYFMYEFI